MKIWFILLTLSIATPVFADKIVLTTGTELEGTVTVYSNLYFYVTTNEGRNVRHAASSVRLAQFDARPRTAAILTPTGKLAAGLVKYENSTFYLAPPGEPEKPLQSILVKTIEIPPPDREDTPRFTAGETVDHLVIPDSISHGTELTADEVIVRGRVTVVFFWGNVGAPGVQCRLMNNYVNNVIAKQPNIAIRKVDIGEWDSPVARQFNVTAIPRLDIYDSGGKLQQTIIGNRWSEAMTALKKIH